MKAISEILPEVVENLGLQKQGLRPLKSGNNFQIALRNKRICHLTELEPLKQALRYVMLVVGLREQNLPGEEEKAVLINHILKHFAGHTPEEIKLAFEKAVMGELDCNPICYENFSVLYFSQIMNAYREWAVEQYEQDSKESLQTPEVDRLAIDMEYAMYKQKEINKLPCKI